MISESSQNTLRHNRLRYLVNTENQQQIKLDDMHVTCDPNHNGKEVNVSSTSNRHWQRTQVHIWVRLAWISQQHGLCVGRGSFPHAARAHAHIWSPMTRWDSWPEKRHQSETEASFSEVVGVLFCLSPDFWQNSGHMHPHHTLHVPNKMNFLFFVNSMMSVVSLTL